MRQLFVDSRDRVSGTSTDFSIQLPETLVIEGNGHRMRIDDLRVPMVVPTIQSGVNDQLTVTLGATNYTITIPQGQYDGPGLASKLQTLLAVAPGTWTVAYDTSNIAMKISCTNNFTIVSASSYAVQLFAHPYTQTANSYSFTYVSVLGLDMMYLSSSRFSSLDTIGPQGAHDTLMSAVVTCPFGSVIDAVMPYDTWITIPAMTAQQLDFQLRDRSYKVLSIVPNISFTLTID